MKNPGTSYLEKLCRCKCKLIEYRNSLQAHDADILSTIFSHQMDLEQASFLPTP